MPVRAEQFLPRPINHDHNDHARGRQPQEGPSPKWIRRIDRHQRHRRCPDDNRPQQPMLHKLQDQASHSFFLPSSPSPKWTWEMLRGCRGQHPPRASNEHIPIVRVLRAQRPTSTPLLTRIPAAIPPDTPLQFSPSPSETDPYPSTPSSLHPKIGMYPAKSHQPESTFRCASQTPT